MPNDYHKEGTVIKKILNHKFPRLLDGKSCVLELKQNVYNWKQMEWIGFYLEYIGRKILMNNYGGEIGPTFGRTTFDYMNNYVWDFKAHVLNSSSPNDAIMNDCEAVNKCIEKKDGLGFIIALGKAEYDDNNALFKEWHDRLKEKISKYEVNRKKRGAKSRKRKISFELVEFLIIFLKSKKDIRNAITQGWLSGDSQIGWRNSNGSPRRAKYKIKINKICKDYII